MSDMKFEREFLQGQVDCRAGVTPSSQSEAYSRGYAAQYESEQAATWESQQREKQYGY